MINAGGFFDFATLVPGHPAKVNPGTNPAVGFCGHSAEGYVAYLKSNPPLSPAVGGQKSWHLSNLKDGTLLQNYSIFKRCWHAGEDWPNQNLVSMELEGVAGEAMTEAQLATVVRVIRELSEHQGWAPNRDDPVLRTLHQHNDFHQTSCPSGRYDWTAIMAALQEGDVPEHYAGEANERRAYIALNFNILNHYRTVYTSDGKSVQFVAKDGSIAATLPLAEVPDWAAPL